MTQHFAKSSPLGKEWGPFTDEERAELDRSARRPYVWRTEVVR